MIQDPINNMLKNEWLPLFRSNIHPMQTQTLESYQREIQWLTPCRNCHIKSSTKKFPKNLQRFFIFSSVSWGARKLEILGSDFVLFIVNLLYLFCLSSWFRLVQNHQKQQIQHEFHSPPPTHTQNYVYIKDLVWGHVAGIPHPSVF